MTRLSPVNKIPAYAVIIRAQWERGETQLEAIWELHRRGLWLGEEQMHGGQLRKINCPPWYEQISDAEVTANRLEWLNMRG